MVAPINNVVLVASAVCCVLVLQQESVVACLLACLFGFRGYVRTRVCVGSTVIYEGYAVRTAVYEYTVLYCPV